MKAEERLLTIQEVAKMFGLHLSTMYHLARRKAIPGFKIGKHWRFRPEIIAAFIEEKERQ